ncbi:muconolactone Delta-isomerase family protein [Streptomyces mooreae]|uniref:muconolactone Delta-isomerase family protein n=1 Tax=Streptomyces mooreae TaxID=3075523 RepID=UPI00374E07CA
MRGRAPCPRVWQATDRETLDRALEGLPMAPRLMMPVTHLAPHPSDPVEQAFAV